MYNERRERTESKKFFKGERVEVKWRFCLANVLSSEAGRAFPTFDRKSGAKLGADFCENDGCA